MSSALSLSNAEILRAIAQVAGVKRDAGEWDDNFLIDARDIVRSGLRRFFNPVSPDGMPYQWKFLQHPLYLSGSANYSTGTIQVVNGTVTLTGGTAPSYTADCILFIDGRAHYVETFNPTTPTTFTVNTDNLNVDAGTAYSLVRWRHPIPDDFADFVGQKVVSYRGEQYGRLLRNVMPSEIRTRYATTNSAVDRVCMFSIIAGVPATDDDRWYMAFWPRLDTDDSVIATYRTHPFDNLDTVDLTADGAVVQAPAVHAETLRAAIQAAAEEFFYSSPGIHSARYQERLMASITFDRHSQGPVDFSHYPGADPRRVALLYHTPSYTN